MDHCNWHTQFTTRSSYQPSHHCAHRQCASNALRQPKTRIQPSVGKTVETVGSPLSNIRFRSIIQRGVLKEKSIKLHNPYSHHLFMPPAQPQVVAEHISGANNILADSLSRLVTHGLVSDSAPDKRLDRNFLNRWILSNVHFQLDGFTSRDKKSQLFDNAIDEWSNFFTKDVAYFQSFITLIHPPNYISVQTMKKVSKWMRLPIDERPRAVLLIIKKDSWMCFTSKFF